MGRKRHSTKEIVNELRQAKVELGKDNSVAAVCKLRGELLGRDIFCKLTKVRIPIERWYRHFNAEWLCSNLG